MSQQKKQAGIYLLACFFMNIAIFATNDTDDEMCLAFKTEARAKHPISCRRISGESNSE